MAEQVFLVGIDIDDAYAVASFYTAGMKEPATVSMVAGSEVYQIPVRIMKKKESGQWVIGEEAERAAQEQQAEAADCLFSRALKQEEVRLEGECYAAEELLVFFLRKLIGYAGSLQGVSEAGGLAIAAEELTLETAGLLSRVGEKLGFTKDRLKVMDRKSAFYYFTMNQQENLWLHDVCLYDYRDGRVKCLRLERNLSTVPQLVSIEENRTEISADRQDEEFYQLLQAHMKGHIVSAAYLVGNAFDGDWMKLSLAFICRGRRAFMGKNLYAKGACYAALVAKGLIPWSYTYLGDNEMKVNVSLKVKKQGTEKFFTLLTAGTSWYEAEGVCEVILDDTREIDIWLQQPNSRQAKVEKLTLSDLPDRGNKTTRLRIMAKPLSNEQVKIQIKDMGFGEIAKSSDMSWEYVMSV